MKFSFPPRVALAAAPRRAGAFSLVVTLIIVSMLAVVAIGFLSSMSSERVTADAFGNKTRAEQAAQAGVDSAIAILRQAFKDFPDSATVWETHTVNKDGNATVDADHPTALNNEGTSLYVRAMPTPDPANTSANLPDSSIDNRPDHPITTGQTDPHVTNADGSDARKMFVLPLTSGFKYRQVDQVSNWTDPKVKSVLDPNIRDQQGKKIFDDLYVDLNVRRYKGDSQGWLGSPPRSLAPTLPPRTVRVPWVNIPQADFKGAGTAPTVARYAFWVEDESFRTNINYAGLGTDPASATRNRPDNSGSTVVNQPVDPRVVDLFGPFRFLVNDSSAASFAKALVDTRAIYPGGLFSDALGYSHTTGLTSDVADQLRFLTTTTSSGLNLSRHGTQRVNLNELAYSKADAKGVTTQYSAQEQIDAIVNTIQFHAPNFGQRFYRNVPNANVAAAVSAGTLNQLAVPNTGEPNQNLIYLYKAATNIHDYLSPTLFPTIVDGVLNTQTGKYTGVVHQGIYPSPNAPYVPVAFPYPNNYNLVWAQGKNVGPYIEECAVRFHGGPYGTNNKYQLSVDYFIEVWNPTARDIRATDLGLHPRLRIVSPIPWQACDSSFGHKTDLVSDRMDPVHNYNDDSPPMDYGPGDPEPKRDCDIDLSQVVFPAGKATVITTDPEAKNVNYPVPFSAEGKKNIQWCDFYPAAPELHPGKRVYNGSMPASTTYLLLAPRQTASSDYGTDVILYTDNGYIDCATSCLPLSTGGSTTKIYLTKTSQSTAYYLYGGSLRGNTGNSGTSATDPSASGDPRSNNEQLKVVIYNGSSALNQTRYYNFGTNTTGTLGMPNSDFCSPDVGTGLVTAWPDYYSFSPITRTNSDDRFIKNPLMFVANSALTSIGQLGDVYDPARYSGPDYTLARGGGRTFKIGQHDDRWDGDFRSASRSWTSWRLADFFGIKDSMLQPGLININGVARDNGAALRAALLGFKFLDNTGPGAPTIEKNALAVNAGTSKPGLDALVAQMIKRLAPEASANANGIAGGAPYTTGQGPFFERGEFSELPAFGRNPAPPNSSPDPAYVANDLVNAADMAIIYDRGREEIFRRSAEMITTRGNVFTVYAMGQTLSPTKAVTSTQRIKVTFRLMPKKLNSAGGATTGEDFHPATNAGANGAADPIRFNSGNLAERFSKPDHYDIEILSASKGGG